MIFFIELILYYYFNLLIWWLVDWFINNDLKQFIKTI